MQAGTIEFKLPCGLCQHNIPPQQMLFVNTQKSQNALIVFICRMTF